MIEFYVVSQERCLLIFLSSSYTSIMSLIHRLMTPGSSLADAYGGQWPSKDNKKEPHGSRRY